MPEKQKRHFRLIKRFFFTNRKLQKIQGVPFDRIQKFSEKCRIVPKQNRKGGALWSTLGNNKKLVV